MRIPAAAACLCVLLFAACQAPLRAQDRDSAATAPETGRPPAMAPGPAPEQPRLPGARVLRKDSLALLPYGGAGDLAALAPGVLLHELGIPGHPMLPSFAGAMPWQSAAGIDGSSVSDLVTGAALPQLLPAEDARAFLFLPPHAAFMAGAGLQAAVEEEVDWRDAAQPATRVRHTEGPYSLLFTDVIFRVKPSEGSGFQAGITRRTVGTTGTGNSARFLNMLAESWDLRLRWRQSLGRRTELRAWNLYSDHLAFENGGVQGLASAGLPSLYPDRSSPDYADFTNRAFDPILASFVNPSLTTRLRRDELAVELAQDWADSTHHSALRLIAAASSRSVSDTLNANLGVAWTPSRLDRRSSWSAVGARLEQRGQLAGIRFTAEGEALAAPLSDPAIASTPDDLVAMARLSASFGAGPLRLAAFWRGDRRWGDEGAGLGASAELPLGALRLSAGVSASTRPYTPFERFAAGERIVRTGAFPAEHERLLVADCGLHLDSPAGDADLLLFYRAARTPLRMAIGLTRDSILSSSARFTTVFESAAEESAIGGVALTHGLAWRGLRLDTRATLLAAPATSPSPADLGAPPWEVACTPSFRGELIAGTLGLRVGCTLRARGRYRPPAYNPETGLFGRSLYDGSAQSGGVDADVFLFATIKDAATIHLALRNVFDARTVTTLYYPMEDRAFHFGVDWVLFD